MPVMGALMKMSLPALSVSVLLLVDVTAPPIKILPVLPEPAEQATPVHEMDAPVASSITLLEFNALESVELKTLP
ncbi:hypothetical protein LTEGF4_12540 [Limnohabitans sp. TEGF004]|nr:hypothetical protein LTEGF4_12540 [Limnohabitans sp. TEGF004]